MPCLEKRYVWEVPVRLTHWVNVLAIFTLSLTGLYIGSPRTFAFSPNQYVLGWVRLIHFVSGYLFAISVISRIYWSFVGNSYASWREFFPFFSAKRRHDMVLILRFYLFLDRRVPHPVGHNALAGATYLVLFTLYFVMITTGFALYGQYDANSVQHHLFGWLFSLFSSQGVRLTHHLGMWFLLAFVVHHLYCAWMMDIMEKGGAMSAIFSGYKAVKEKESP